uniref:tRNA and rRNA cytosine-C5-methylase family protein (NSUN2) n=1 Tax=uncultured marine group II/III euryarchaeote AD1000_55_C01 TaxID=1457784 RepID=A0A075FUP0_9EURY|nr:tRNA and rRNA cytosine-C5-methylase family protein (NSUN2) [uncultured marine group II/III euryarchaeote AD1000_55_C01]
MARDSVLVRAVSHWREDSEVWLSGSFDRLPETVRVNPLRADRDWTEGWLERIGSKRIAWFGEPGSAWELPFERGSAEGEVKQVLNALHETGRLTRQEASSMLPVLALGARPGHVVLDMCASPGSKTTQIAEHLGDSGLVLANEIVNSRVNMLVTNVQRHSSRPVAVIHHDGRHLPRVPESGFDRILVDAPCTGSGTTRKNPDVWGRWLPSGGRSLHNLQVALLSKASTLLKPGGRIVYSTCSLDPVEDEAVVAEVLRSSNSMSLLPTSPLLAGVPGEQGRAEWSILDDEGAPSEEEVPKSMLPPEEEGVAEQLALCMRVWNDSIGGGGFFLAVLEKSSDAPSRPVPDNVSLLDSKDVKPDAANSPQPLPESLSSSVQSTWGELSDNLWVRGKRLLLSTPEARVVWESSRSRRGGRIRVPGGRWRPLRVMHLGLNAAMLRDGEVERVVAGAARVLGPHLPGASCEVDGVLIDTLLEEEGAPVEGGVPGDIKGGLILVDSGNGDCLPVWVGGRISLMLGNSERLLLALQRGLTFNQNEGQ